MRKIHVMLLALTAVFSLSVAVTSGASAAEWLLDGKSLTAAATVESIDVGGIKLTDMKGGVFNEEVTVACKGTDKGTVGPGAADRETEVVATKCKTTKGTCATEPTVVVLHTPWETSLANAVQDVLKVGPPKESPGYEIHCSFNIIDKCEIVTNVVLPVKNLTAAESGNDFDDVDLEFTQAEAENKPAKCSRGGENQGLIVGEILVLDPEGDLAVS